MNQKILCWALSSTWNDFRSHLQERGRGRKSNWRTTTTSRTIIINSLRAHLQILVFGAGAAFFSRESVPTQFGRSRNTGLNDMATRNVQWSSWRAWSAATWGGCRSLQCDIMIPKLQQLGIRTRAFRSTANIFTTRHRYWQLLYLVWLLSSTTVYNWKIFM